MSWVYLAVVMVGTLFAILAVYHFCKWVDETWSD